MPTPACQCTLCRRACTVTPGWFLPGEAQKAAALLGLPFKAFFQDYLGINWWEADERSDTDIFVLAPAITSMDPGEEYPGSPYGCCVFYEGGLCTIHAAKPFECAETMHADSGSSVMERHWQIANAWRKHQGEIRALLGREPKSEYFCADLE